MVKRLCSLILLTLLSSLLAAQTPLATSTTQPTQEVVTGTLQLPPGTPATNTKVRFQLVYCGGNSGRVVNPDGSITMVSFVPFDLSTSNGIWSTPLYGSDQIICGNQQGVSRWRINPIFNGVNGPAFDYQIESCAGRGLMSGCQFDLDTAPQCSATIIINCVQEYPYVVPPPPPITGPPGPQGPPGPAGANPGLAPEIAFYASDGSLVSGNPRFTDDSSTLSYLGNTYSSGNNTVDSILYVAGAYYMDTTPSAAQMVPAPAGRSAMGVSSDGNFYISPNGGAPAKICTAGDTACGTGGSNPGTQPQIAYYASTGNLVSGNPRFTDNGTTLSYSGSGYVSGNDTIDQILYVNGAYYMDTTPTTIPMAAAPTGRSAMGVSNDGNFYISANAGAPAEICTSSNGVCATGGTGPGTASQIAYYQTTGNNVVGNPNFTDSSGTLSYSGNGYISGNDTIDSLLMVKGAWYLDTLPPASAVTAAPAGRSSFAVNTDGAFYISENAGPPSKICTAANGMCYSATTSVNSLIGGPPTAWGFQASLGILLATGSSDVAPTATVPAGKKYVTPSTASTLTQIGMTEGQNGNNSNTHPLAAFNHFGIRIALQSLTNSRFYWGLATWNTASTQTGTTATPIYSSTRYATDTPTGSTIGFRFSSTTDTNFQALAVNGATGSMTLINSGVAADTNSHLFEIIPTSSGTAMNYYIDKILVATISTNLPSPTPPNISDSMADMFWTGDNKNTANVASLTFYYMDISHRQ